MNGSELGVRRNSACVDGAVWAWACWARLVCGVWCGQGFGGNMKELLLFKFHIVVFVSPLHQYATKSTCPIRWKDNRRTLIDYTYNIIIYQI